VTRGARAVLAGLVAAIALEGCATRTIELGYPEGAATPGVIASVERRRVVLAAVTDRRADKTRIGATLRDGTPIQPLRPVTAIVRDALVAELGRNGHRVVAGEGDVVVAVDVEEFWLDAVGRAAPTQYVGRVAIALVVADGRTGDRLLTRRYVGIRRHTGEPDASDVWREVMATALARTIHDLATDRDLAATMGLAPL
jgi:uncharacterized lipoprotein YajG